MTVLCNADHLSSVGTEVPCLRTDMFKDNLLLRPSKASQPKAVRTCYSKDLILGRCDIPIRPSRTSREPRARRVEIKGFRVQYFCKDSPASKIGYVDLFMTLTTPYNSRYGSGYPSFGTNFYKLW
jgi:hypothetical protein